MSDSEISESPIFVFFCAVFLVNILSSGNESSVNLKLLLDGSDTAI